ncbi:MAG TPA: hypothetical protein VFA38_01425, partial [Nitrospirales bacterium]|nr:hypothetical protein [Nitrospirales bacterium]
MDDEELTRRDALAAVGRFVRIWLIGLPAIDHTAPQRISRPLSPPESTGARMDTPQTQHPYRLPEHVVPSRYDLRLAPDLTTFRFDGDVTIAVDVRQATSVIWLNAAELDIRRATITGAGG